MLPPQYQREISIEHEYLKFHFSPPKHLKSDMDAYGKYEIVEVRLPTFCYNNHLLNGAGGGGGGGVYKYEM